MLVVPRGHRSVFDLMLACVFNALVLRGHWEDRKARTNVCLIPSSRHSHKSMFLLFHSSCAFKQEQLGPQFLVRREFEEDLLVVVSHTSLQDFVDGRHCW